MICHVVGGSLHTHISFIYIISRSKTFKQLHTCGQPGRHTSFLEQNFLFCFVSPFSRKILPPNTHRNEKKNFEISYPTGCSIVYSCRLRGRSKERKQINKRWIVELFFLLAKRAHKPHTAITHTSTFVLDMCWWLPAIKLSAGGKQNKKRGANKSQKKQPFFLVVYRHLIHQQTLCTGILCVCVLGAAITSYLYTLFCPYVHIDTPYS